MRQREGDTRACRNTSHLAPRPPKPNTPASLARTHKPSPLTCTSLAEVFNARVSKLYDWLAARPESTIAVVAHWGLLHQLTGGVDFANCAQGGELNECYESGGALGAAHCAHQAVTSCLVLFFLPTPHSPLPAAAPPAAPPACLQVSCAASTSCPGRGGSCRWTPRRRRRSYWG